MTPVFVVGSDYCEDTIVIMIEEKWNVYIAGMKKGKIYFINGASQDKNGEERIT